MGPPGFEPGTTWGLALRSRILRFLTVPGILPGWTTAPAVNGGRVVLKDFDSLKGLRFCGEILKSLMNVFSGAQA